MKKGSVNGQKKWDLKNDCGLRNLPFPIKWHDSRDRWEFSSTDSAKKDDVWEWPVDVAKSNGKGGRSGKTSKSVVSRGA